MSVMSLPSPDPWTRCPKTNYSRRSSYGVLAPCITLRLTSLKNSSPRVGLAIVVASGRCLRWKAEEEQFGEVVWPGKHRPVPRGQLDEAPLGAGELAEQGLAAG